MITGRDLFDLSRRGASLQTQRRALAEALRQREVAEVVIKTVMEHVRDGVALSGDLPAGRSRFGGPGKLPAGTAWPRLTGNTSESHLGFLMEIALDELPRVERLPADGTLLIFQEMETLGLCHDLLDATRVFYVSPGHPMIQPQPPEKLLWPLAQKPLGARALPIAGEAEVVMRKLCDSPEHDRVIEAMNDLVPDSMQSCHHWLLGSAVETQGPVLEEVPYQLSLLPPASQRRFSAELRSGHGWSLLAQIGEEYDREIGLDFGIADGGSHFLCIPDEDLDQLRFDRVIGFFQSH